MRRGLGVVHVVFRGMTTGEAARKAAALGFDHIDVPCEWEGALDLPIGDRMAFPEPRPNASVPAPPKREGAWDRAVALYRRTPGLRVEPWPGSIIDSVRGCRELLAAVPGLQLLVDTGHVACWGEDPVELLPFAGHVQLRQARRGVPQALDGDVDFAEVFRALDRCGYPGLLSVEYFDLPELGWPLADPVGHAVELAARIRLLLR